MKVYVEVMLDKHETLAYTPDAAAQQVIVALGGSLADDWCSLTVRASPEPGTAGKPPDPLAPPTEGG
jgi:hypothetical protein